VTAERTGITLSQMVDSHHFVWGDHWIDLTAAYGFSPVLASWDRNAARAVENAAAAVVFLSTHIGNSIVVNRW